MDVTWQEIFAAVKNGKRIEPDRLVALEAILKTAKLPYFVMVYVGVEEGGKVIASNQQAVENITYLLNDLKSLPPLDDKEITETWD